MSIPKHITEFLDSKGVRYRHSTHSPAFTAQETAHAQHVSGKHVAKTVMVMADDRLVMTVVPANCRLELDKLRQLLKATRLRLAQEKEFGKVFPGCEVGAMPPFGNLYHVGVWVDATLKESPMIIFNAGTHTDTIEMSFADFERLVQPGIARFAEAEHGGAAGARGAGDAVS